MNKLQKILELVVSSDRGIILNVNNNVKCVTITHITKDVTVFSRHAYYKGDLVGYEDEYTTTIDKLIIELENYIKENGK